MKCCSKCGEIKELSEFGKRKLSKDGLQAWCKECSNQNNKIHHEENADSINARHRQDYLNKKNVYRERHMKWEKENIEKRKKQSKLWRSQNVHKINAARARYQAKKKQSVPEHLIDCETEKKRVRDIYNLCTLISKSTGIPHEVDHMWPLADGGPHWSGNLQIITQKENRSKNATVIPEIKQTIQAMLDSNHYIAYTKA